MSETALYPEGRPCWVDLLAHQQEAAMEYYAQLFGWTYDVSPPEYGGYALAKVGTMIVAGVGRPPGGSAPDSAAFWTTYLAADDAKQDAEDNRTAADAGSWERQVQRATGRQAAKAEADRQGLEAVGENGIRRCSSRRFSARTK